MNTETSGWGESLQDVVALIVEATYRLRHQDGEFALALTYLERATAEIARNKPEAKST